MKAYCVKCKEKREIQNPEPVYTDTGRPGTRGTCPECGTNMFRMGETEAHASIPTPEAKPTRKKEPRPRDGRLVIVESPAKARTVGKFLGGDYRVEASIGHVRDLLKSRLSVDVANDFEPTYRVPNEKRDVVKELRKEVKTAEEIYLATDPDREGEAIAWHLLAAARIPDERAHRVVFHEITKDAIDDAFSHPRGIDMDLVNAQQARRILDRLVGYKISPLLWEKVKSRLSAGRVQSVALRLVVEREREIDAFEPEEYWSIEAELAKRETQGEEPRPTFEASLHSINGERLEKFDIKNAEQAQRIVDDLEGGEYVVGEVRRRERRRYPRPPFTTSTMQQRASRSLNFNGKRAMRVAQQLYEGIDIGEEGTVGLITYMRTDSVNVAPAAQSEARAYVNERYDSNFLPPNPPQYETESKAAQEAHEAIRPTSVKREPKAIKKHLTRDQYRLYNLIWKRFLASQMAPAVLDTTSVDIDAGKANGEKPYMFRATGSVLKFLGFLVLYRGDKDEEEQENLLPPLSDGELLDLIRLIPNQHWTQPSPRYTEATLVKALEEHGIGRPSTYAPIISTIQQRSYVERIEKYLHPTELGIIVNDLLVEHFPNIMDVGFTAAMEEDLDRIASGRREWVEILREFYGPFEETLERAKDEMEEVDVGDERTGENCPQCGHPLVIKWGRYGKFVGCSDFPNCRFTKPYFEKVGVNCPECGGDIVEKRTRKGNRIFYGCINYPECEFSVWNRPLPEPCPNCGGLLTQARKEEAKCQSCETWFELTQLEEQDRRERSGEARTRAAASAAQQ